MSVPLKDSRWVFLGGFARSGTTYLQLLLHATGAFATAQESHVFPQFVSPLYERWRRFDESAQSHRSVGLPTILTEEVFDTILRGIVRPVIREIAARNPAASWVVEKTPENVTAWPLIIRLFPAARFLIVVRDPRAVVASTIAARTWATDWAHREVGALAEAWVRAVKSGLALEEAHPYATTRVHYERLRERTPAVLGEVLARFGLKISQPELRRIAEKVSIENVREGQYEAPWPLSAEPVGFFRSGLIDAWRSELSVADIALIEDIAKEEMMLMGYRPVIKLGSGKPEPKCEDE